VSVPDSAGQAKDPLGVRPAGIQLLFSCSGRGHTQGSTTAELSALDTASEHAAGDSAVQAGGSRSAPWAPAGSSDLVKAMGEVGRR
jgi:hypothetical protein